jgi:hypothetical protein
MGICYTRVYCLESDLSDDNDLNSNMLLTKLSIKRSNNIESFLKLAYQHGNQIDALRGRITIILSIVRYSFKYLSVGILVNETARLKLLEFLREEYYYGAAEYYEVN